MIFGTNGSPIINLESDDMTEDTLNIECLMQAINEYTDVKSERDKARDGYDGYLWGYHGSYFEDVVAKKAAEVKNQLRSTVREMIREELSTNNPSHGAAGPKNDENDHV